MGIRTYANLNRKLNKLVKDGMKDITKFAFNEVRSNIYTYYDEYKPKSYKRTSQFFNSAYAEDVREIGGTFFSQVGIDYESMSYWMDYTKELKDEEGANQLPVGEHGELVFLENGYRVVKSANEGDHGVEFIAKTTNNHFWDDALFVTWNDAVMRDFAKNIEHKTGCKCEAKNGWMLL